MGLNIDYEHAPPETPAPLASDDGLIFARKERYRRRTLKPLVDPSRVLIFTPDRNHTRRDYTGAFRPEAQKFAELHGLDDDQIIKLDISQPHTKVGEEVIRCVGEWKPQVVVFFCHGYVGGIQLGIWSPTYRRATNASKRIFGEFLDLMALYQNPSIVLYCCSTGDTPFGKPDTAPGAGDDSFADLVRDGLCERGARTNRVFAHVTAGHTTRNPHVKFFDGDYSPIGGTGASYLARPGTPAFRKLAKALKTDFRFRIPFMTTGRIHELLANS